MSTTDEQLLPGSLPLWEVPGWHKRFGVAAGITGRGSSGPPGFDLGLWTAQPVAEVMARWRTFHAAFPGFHGSVLAQQVHGSTVLAHESRTTGWRIIEGADGHVTAVPGLLLLVTVADCIPVYLFETATRTVALVHAGWRGTAGGILGNAVQRMTSGDQSRVKNIVMHCGPGISGMEYEVGREVMDGLGLAAGGPGPWHADIRGVLAEQARFLGIRDVTVSGHCTSRENGDFYSHRASQGLDGRMVAWLGVEP